MKLNREIRIFQDVSGENENDGQRTAQSRLVIEISLDYFNAIAAMPPPARAIRRARQAAQGEPSALERSRDPAALFACYSGDENRSIARPGYLLRPT